MKKCTKCGGENTTSNRWCTECKRAYDAVYYSNPENRAKQQERVRLRNERIDRENQERVLQYLLEHPCVDCSESDPVVLQFDHQRDKSTTISALLKGGYSWKRLEEEIEKCEVRCANCHCRRTAEQFGWFKHLASVAERI